VAGKYTLLSFLSPPVGTKGAPRRQLQGFGGVWLGPGEATVAEVMVSTEDVSLAQADGAFAVVNGSWRLAVDGFAVELTV
jgi:hypothetical protein